MSMNRIQSVLIVSLGLLLAATVSSAQTVEERDLSGMAGLKISPGAAHGGTAGAFGAVATDVFSLYYNPAGSVKAGKYAVGVMHHEWISDVRSEYLAFIWRPSRIAFGGSILYNSVGEIERRESASTEPLSLFDAQDIVAGITAGFYISPDFSLGLTAKLLYEKIDVSSGTAYAIDIGGYYEFLPNVHVGMAVSNLGSKIQVNKEKNDLPTIIRAGGSFAYRDFDFGLSVVTPTDDQPHLHIGADRVISDIFTIRAGYATGYDVRSVAFGFGVKHDFVGVDYSYTPIESDLGDSHRFSLTLTWR